MAYKCDTIHLVTYLRHCCRVSQCQDIRSESADQPLQAVLMNVLPNRETVGVELALACGVKACSVRSRLTRCDG